MKQSGLQAWNDCTAPAVDLQPDAAVAAGDEHRARARVSHRRGGQGSRPRGSSLLGLSFRKREPAARKRLHGGDQRRGLERLHLHLQRLGRVVGADQAARLDADRAYDGAML
jgi:hypothetical protein